MRRPTRRTARRLRTAVVNAVAGSPLITRKFRAALLRRSGMQLGNVLINPRCYFGANALTMGDGCFVNVGCVFDNSAPITLGRNVHLGPNVTVITSRHVVTESTDERVGPVTPKPVTIHDGVGIGANTVILSGVTIGAGALIGAGSVVAKDCEPNGLYVGVPARKVRTFGAKDEPAVESW